MKKNGLLRLLGIMSCVTLLASCGAKAPENPELVVKAFPETFHVGEVLDLDSYVSVKGTSKSFDVYLYKASQEVASLSGHKITIKDEGEIKFKVSLGDYSQTIIVNSLTEMRDSLMKTFAGYTDNYVVIGNSTEDIFIHRAEYAERLQSVTEGEQTTTYRSGFISPEDYDATYKFAIGPDFVPSYQAQIYAKADMSKYFGSFGVDFTKATRGTTSAGGQKFETYELPTAQFRNFVSNVLLSTYNDYSYCTTVDGDGKYDASSTTYGFASITLKKAQFTVLSQGSEKMPAALLYATLGGKETLVDILLFANGADAEPFQDGIVEYFIAQGLQVGTPYPGLFKSIFTEEIPESKSYVAEFDYGWVNKAGEHVQAPDTEGTIFDGVPDGKSTRVLTENAIVTIENGVIIEGVANNGGNVYNIKYDGTSYSSEYEPDYSDVYEDRYHSLAFIGNDDTWKDDMLYPNTKSSTETNLVFNANLTRHYELIDSICSCEDNAAKIVPILYKFESRDIKGFFNFSLSYDVTASKLSVTYQLQWDNTTYYKVAFSVQPDTEGQYDGMITDLLSEIFN